MASRCASGYRSHQLLKSEVALARARVLDVNQSTLTCDQPCLVAFEKYDCFSVERRVNASRSLPHF